MRYNLKARFQEEDAKAGILEHARKERRGKFRWKILR